MATSGALSTSNENIKYKITIAQNSQNVANNTSNVTVSVKFYRTNTGYTTYGTGTVYCKINGTTYSASVTPSDEITSSGIVLFTKTLNISHDSDGTKKLTVSAWISHERVTSSEQSYSMNLTTIPRATTPTVNVTSADMNTSVTISMPRASSSFTHTLKYTFGSETGTIGSSLGTSKAWTIPLSLANQIPNATSGSLTITCETYNGSTKIGSKTVKITIKVPASVVPTISSISVVDSNTGVSSKFGALIQNQSKPTITVNASGVYSSTIASYSTKFLGVTYTAKSFTVSNLTQSGTLSIVTTIKDSRGRTASLTQNISVLAYSIPSISLFTAQRCNSDGTINLEGQYLKITYAFSISSLSNLNTKSYTLAYKLSSATSFTTLKTDTSVYSANTSYVSTIIFDVNSSYNIRLTVSDYFKTVTYDEILSTAFTLMDFHESGRGMAFGGVASVEDEVEFIIKARFNNGENPQGAKAIKSGDDLNNYVEPGYYLFSSAVGSTVLNKPFTTSGSGSLEVIREGESNQVRQVITRCSANREIWERVYYSNTWYEWRCIHKGGDARILWSGGMYMTAGHTATLSETVSSQPNGIVLIFSRYSGSTVQNYHYNHFFVHKAFVKNHSGVGSTFVMATGDPFEVMASKYLYIHNDKIVGNDTNNASGTGGSGIVYNNAGFVLRYVIGV